MLKIVTPAIVLRRQGFQEADRKVVFMTQSHGKVTTYVKGVRLAKGKLVSLIEPFNEMEVQLQVREEKGLATLIGGTLKKSHPLLRSRLPAFAAACTLCELTDALSPDLVSHPAVFQLLSEALSILERTHNPTLIRLGYTLQFLREIGYGLSEQLKIWNLTSEERRLYELINLSPLDQWNALPPDLTVKTEHLEKHLRQFLDDYLPKPLLSADFQETIASSRALAHA
jgi:hypothetical protein